MNSYFLKVHSKSLRLVVSLGVISAITACATAPQPVAEKRAILEPIGENAGRAVIFSPASKNTQATLQGHKQNVAALFVNDYFLAALPKNHYVSQGLCVGNYNLNVRSVNEKLTPDQKVVRYSTPSVISIEKGKTSYFELVRSNEKWDLKPINEKQAKKYQKFFEEDKQLVRRIPASLMKCKP